MPRQTAYDAVIIGSGPNGLAAAITIARSGYSVLVIEARDTVGGGTRSAELTLPGFIHDICSTIQSIDASPFFRSQPLANFGLELVYPPSPLAHPLDDGTAVLLERSVQDTSQQLGKDGSAYRRLMGPFVSHSEQLMQDLLGPLPIPPHHPILLARFGLRALLPAKTLIDLAFHEKRARALFAGLAAHSIQPLERSPTASFGIMLGIFAHDTGWPVVRGGSQNLANALSGYLLSLGGEIITGWPVKTLGELPEARAYLFDVTPRQILSIAGDHLPSFYKRQLENFRYGPGVYKVDYALSTAIPWTAKECLQAATVHLGGTMEEIAASERSVWDGKPPERPFVLLAQQTLFDTSRAPEGKQTVWAYCHVPNGSSFDMVDRIESQVERFAPGFRDCILARNVITPSGIEQYDANYIGGDINGGVEDLRQLFTRPAIRLNPYTTPNHSIFICSSSTPPGGGVHGMCGFHAAKTVIREF